MDILEILGRIGFDWRMALFSGINFLIVLLIMKQFIFGPIGKAISQRQQTITKGLEDAEQVKIELAHAETKSNEIIQEAKKEGSQIIKKSQEDATKVSEKMKLTTQDEIEKLYSKSKEQIESERVKMLDSIKEDTANLAILASEQIIKKKLSTEEDKKIINDFLDQISTK